MKNFSSKNVNTMKIIERVNKLLETLCTFKLNREFKIDVCTCLFCKSQVTQFMSI